MLRICNALANENFRVTIIGFEKENDPKFVAKNYTSLRLKLFFTSGKLFYLEYNLKLFFHLIKRKFDIYCAIDLDTALPHYLASKWYKKTMVLDAHELYLGLPEIQHRPFTKKLWTVLEKWIYPTIKKGYTVNQSIANWYNSEYNIDMEVVRNCPNKIESLEQKENYILYQGALNEGRGLEELIEAMQWVNGHLKIAGSGEIDEELRSLAKKFGVQNKVEFLGYLQPVELLKVTQKAYIGLNLLKGDCLNYYYSLANKFFDYLHASVPQITMDFPEYKLINQQYEIAVLAKNLRPGYLARQLNNLAENKTLYNMLAENCEQAKEVFNWQNELKKLTAFYQRLEQ